MYFLMQNVTQTLLVSLREMSREAGTTKKIEKAAYLCSFLDWEDK